MHEHAVRLGHDVEDLVGDGDAAERDVAGGDALGEGGDVRLEAVRLHAEHLAGAAEAADDLVGDQQDVVLLEDRGDRGPVAVRRHDHSAGALDRLADHGGDGVGAFARDRLLELVRELGDELVLARGRRRCR